MSEKAQNVLSIAGAWDERPVQEEPLSGQGLSELHGGDTASQSKSANRGDKSKDFKNQNKTPKDTLPGRTVGPKAEEINSEASMMQTESPEYEVIALKSKLGDREGKIQELEQRIAKLEDLNAKQAMTIRTQSQTIAKNPAPYKNQQRWIELMREQLNNPVHEASRFASSSNNPVTSTATQQPLAPSSDNWGTQGPTLRPSTTEDLPAALNSDATRVTAPRGPRAGGAFTTQNHALRPLQDLLLGQAAQGSRLSLLPESRLRDSRPDIPSTGDPLPSSTIRNRPALIQPPGLGTSMLQQRQAVTQHYSATPLQSLSQHRSHEAPASPLTGIHDAFDGLYRKTEQWAIDYASDPSQAYVVPMIAERTGRCGITDDQALQLLSNPHSKSLLVARLLNSSIQDHCLTSDFLRSIDADFSSQIERTCAQVQGSGPRSAGLHRNVMINIAELFTSLPHRRDWNDWIKATVPEVTSQLYEEVKTLLSLDVLADLAREQQAVGRLTAIIMDAVELSVLMFSQPFLYRLLFAEIGSNLNPEYMKVVGRQGLAVADSITQATVVLGISPLVYADLWDISRLVGYIIRSGDVMV